MSNRQSWILIATLSIPGALGIALAVIVAFQDSIESGIWHLLMVGIAVGSMLALAGIAWIVLARIFRDGPRRLILRKSTGAVFFGHSYSHSRESLLQLGVPLQELQTTYFVEVDSAGISVWFGRRPPRRRVHLPWTEIFLISPGIEHEMGATLYTRLLSIRGLDVPVCLSFNSSEKKRLAEFDAQIRRFGF